jgi:1-acyl-sn-glycerol-3-phosphate acyltransferase
MVLIGAPHTSNMDGVLSIAMLTALGVRASIMIKDSAFHGPMGVVLRWFGALPVNRSSPKGVVEQTMDAFRSNQKFIVLIAPEGTRSAASKWKMGFYHVAAGVGVPVVPAAIDYARKLITFGPALLPSGDQEADMARLFMFYRDNSSPRHAERMSKPLCEAQGRAWQPLDDDD